MVSSLQRTKLRPSSDPYYDLGQFSIKVSTTSSEARTWFARALMWTFCFNHDEAIRCYQQAISHDEDLALAYWGLSFCSGPNYNRTWRFFDENAYLVAVRDCYRFSRQALQRADNAAPWEKGLIEALSVRHPDDDPGRDLGACDKAYADAMRDVYTRFGTDDFNITTLFADALMNVAPRKMFNTADGQPILDTPVLEVKELLETTLRMPGVETHPGPAHMYIHLMEMSATPEAALPAGNMIRDLVPDTGHTYHMPAHIDVLVGNYHRAVEYNLKATIADDKFFQKNDALTFYSYYRLHDYHSLVYAALLSGRSKAALSATDRMEATITDELLRSETPSLADWMEFFKAVRVHVYIRFGMWAELKVLEPEKDTHLYCVTNVFRHYGKAIAHAATGEVQEADMEYELFKQASLRVPPTRLDFPNKITDILEIATAMLDGEIEYRKGHHGTAFDRLRNAIELEDNLPFAEPWGWMLPARHAYAALSLEQGLIGQATAAYAEDLGLSPTPKRSHQHPNNVWALHGYHECLVRLGRDAEAGIIKKQLNLAAAEADVSITSSCFCRLSVPHSIDSATRARRKCCSGESLHVVSGDVEMNCH